MPGERPTLLPSPCLQNRWYHQNSIAFQGQQVLQADSASVTRLARQTSQDSFFKVFRTINPEISSRQIIIILNKHGDLTFFFTIMCHVSCVNLIHLELLLANDAHRPTLWRWAGKLKMVCTTPALSWTVCPALSKSSLLKCSLQISVLSFATKPSLLRASSHCLLLSRLLGNL